MTYEKPEIYELVRTVDELFDDGSEGVIEVKAMRTQGKYGMESIILDVDGDGHGIHIHSTDQAERLMRAIDAAARRLDWETLDERREQREERLDAARRERIAEREKDVQARLRA